ncbi:polysaccharide biosynthesis tyrosine autokinase [Scytonema sp. UIC 10036]|uniref:GumC family protein n=1 Tax=Scytonema sp. UIC 10036 TaxID=2304196 RepID=UPI0012DA5C7F|nr:polysaccharide biosynthesis tyrosine autokinase [Scytonema sp. UIC 10036]
MDTQVTVVNLDKYWQLLKRHGLPALGFFVFVFLISLLAFSLRKPSYEAEGKLSLQNNTISSLTGVGTEIGKLEPLAGDRSHLLNTEAEIISSVPVVQKTINLLNLKDNEEQPLKPKDFVKRLVIKEVKGSDVLQISYKDTNPKICADVVNTLMQVYLDQNIFFHRMEVGSARKFIEKHLPKAELVVRQAEAELRKFKEKNQIVVLPEEATSAVARMADLQKQIGDSQSRIADLTAQSQALRNQLKMNSQQAVAETSLTQSPGVQDILKEIQRLETELATKRATLLDTHPTIINLKSNLAAFREILKRRVQNVAGTSQLKLSNNLQLGELQQTLTARLVELDSTRLGLTNQISALTRLQYDYRKRLEVLPRLEQQQRELERQLEAAQSTYSLLLQKFQEIRIAENQNIGNARIISAAQVPEEPTSSPMLLYLSAGLIANLAALASIYILEAQDKSIKTVDEVKELLGVTLLGIIPSVDKPKKSICSDRNSEFSLYQLVVRDTPRSALSEAYRMLRANLRFISADKEVRVIVVTSSVPREGKSTIAANLATAMAQMESKVLLIDADLHRPVQHQIWELCNSEGLSNTIVGQAETRTAIKKVWNNLDVLTSGVVPPSPGALLDSKRMAGLIESFAATYDFVIIDAPALTVAADAATLGHMADGVLFVVRPGIVDSASAIFAQELLEKSGQKVLGYVVNAVSSNNKRYNYYFTEGYTSDTPVRTPHTSSVRSPLI